MYRLAYQLGYGLWQGLIFEYDTDALYVLAETFCTLQEMREVLETADEAGITQQVVSRWVRA